VRRLGVVTCAAWLLVAGNTAAWSQIGGTEVPTDRSDTPAGIDQVPGMPDQTPTMLAQRREASGLVELPAMSGPVDAATYRLGPGDVLRLQMWGRVSTSSMLQVGPEGAVIVPGFGTMQVSGRTLADVRHELIGKLQTRFRGVNMDLRLARPRTFFVYVTGQVKTTGPVPVNAASRVFDLVSPGLLLDNGSTRRIIVTHTDGVREIADLELFTRIGDPTLNPYLRDGDVINVPVATEFIYSMGAFARPQRFELGTRDSLITLFHLAGDPVPAADVNRALLLRWKDPLTPESLWVRLDDIYARRMNPPLREGDRIYLYYLSQYHLQHEAVIFGEVNRPGPYPIVEGKHHLSDLVSSAGGFLPTADLSAINVHRRAAGSNEKDPELDRLLRLSRDQLTMSEYDALNTKLAGLREGYRVDWNRLKANPKELDLLLRDGDIVTVDRLVNSIRVDGQVKRPGILTFRTGQVVRDYIQQAGGFTDRAWKSRIRVTRAVTGQVLPVGNVKSLDPGDFVWVPERPDKTNLDYLRETLTALAQVATVIIAIRSIR
jgi:polysaccharide biosynthesis/export protein